MSQRTFIPNSDAEGWIIAPASRCVQFVAEQMVLGGVLQRSIVAAANQRALVLLAREFVAQQGKSVVPFDVLLREQDGLEARAEEIRSADFHSINVSVLVACWSALEVAVEDTVILLLLKLPYTVQTVAGNGVDLSKQFRSGISEESATKAAKLLERYVRNSTSAGHAMAEILRICGVSVACDQACLEQLSEINAIRNCILHRGGVCDQRTVNEAPALGLHEGDIIHLGIAQMNRYLDAICCFSRGLISAAVTLFPICTDSQT